MNERRIDGVGPAIVFAHGAGVGMDSPFMAQTAAELASRGFRVVRFEFPYMLRRREDGKRRPPDPMARLEDAFRAVVRDLKPPFAFGGKSMGARVATRLADACGASAAFAFGYPFHPPHDSKRLRIAHLRSLETPTLILQGERDPFGAPEEVADYPLSPAVRLQWIPDGDHGLAPRKRSGRTLKENLDLGIDTLATFLGPLLGE